MEDITTLIWAMLFGAIGLGFLTYGRRQKAIIPLITGVTLIVFPYFVSNVYAIIGIGVLLMAIPYFFRG